MPYYDFKCEQCGKVEEKFLAIRDLDRIRPKCCNHDMKHIIGNYAVIPDLKPYWDENMSCKPVYVKSKKHRKQLMKEHGVYEIYGKGWK